MMSELNKYAMSAYSFSSFSMVSIDNWRVLDFSVFFFFFSSRRRHTRSLCDWSSDVCSSDLLMAVVSLRDDYATARQYYPQLRAEVTSVHLRIYGTGNVAIGHDFDKYLAADLQRAELVSLLIIVPLLLLVFATVISMLLPLGVGGLAVVGGLAAVGLLARVTDVSTYATNIVTLIGLGVAIDYSLFIVNRFREELAGGQTVESALIHAIRTSSQAGGIPGH